MMAPPATATTPAGWQFEVASNVGDAVKSLAATHYGEDVYVLAMLQATQMSALLVRNGTTHAWTKITSDVTSGGVFGGVAAFTPQSVIVCTRQHILVSGVAIGSTGAGKDIWRSSDGGATWTNTYTEANIVQTKISQVNGENLTMGVVSGTSNSGTLRFYITHDCGATWNHPASNGIRLEDNAGCPTCNGNGLPLSTSAGNWWSIKRYHAGFTTFSSNLLAGVGSVDGGDFWTVTYASDGSLTPKNFFSNPDGFSGNPCGGGSGGINSSPVIFARGEATIYPQLFTCGSTATVGYRLFDGCDACVGAAGPGAGYGGSILSGNGGPQRYAGDSELVSACTGTINVGLNPAVYANKRNEAIIAAYCTNTPTGFTIYYKASPTTPLATSYTSTNLIPFVGASGQNDAFTAVMTDTHSYLIFSNSTNGGRLELLSVDTPPILATGPDNVISVTGLLDMRVDSFGTGAMIARLASPGPQIVTYNPSTLVQRAVGTISCDDTKQHGIMAYMNAIGSNYVAYADCTNTADRVNTLRIRSGSLSPPDLSQTVCTSGSGTWCVDDLITEPGAILMTCPGSSSQELPGNADNMQNMLAVPIDYSNGQSGLGGAFSPITAQTAIGFAFTDASNGNIGIWVDRPAAGGSNKSCGLELPFADPGELAGTTLCSWRDPTTKQDYLAGASQSGNSQVWTATVDPKFNGGGGTAPNVQIVTRKSLQATPFSKLVALACPSNAAENGGDVIIMKPDGTVWRISISGPTLPIRWGGLSSPYSTTVQGLATTHGLAMSGDGKWYAFIRDATHVAIGNATTGQITGMVLLPSGTFKAMAMDDTGQTLWVATQTNIASYNLQPRNFTTTAPVSPGTRCTTTCYQINPDGSVADTLPNDDGTCPAGYVLTTVGGSQVCRFIDTGASAGQGTTNGGLPGVDADEFAAAMGITKEAGGWLLGILLIGMLAFGAYMAFGRNTWAAGGGGVLGFGMSLAFGMLPLWFLLFVVLGLIVFLFLRMRGGGA